MSTMTLENFLIKDDFESRLDAHLSAQITHLDIRFAELQAHMDMRFAELQARMDKHFDHTMAKLDHNFRFMIITQSIILAAVVRPYVERLMSL